MPKLLSTYAGPTFADPNHPGFGQGYLILNGNQNGAFRWTDTRQGSAHTVTFCIPWEGIAAFRQYVLTSAQISGNSLVRTLPATSPYAAIFPGTYATKMAGRGDGSDAGVTDSRLYEDCIVDVDFETFPYPTEGSGAFIEVSASGSADYDTVPDAVLAFGNGEKIDHDAGVLVGQLAYQVTYHQLPDVSSWGANLQPLKGKASSAAMAIDGVIYPAGAILFPTFEYSKSVDAFGNVTATGTVSLIQRDIPWNSGIRSDGVVDAITPAPYQLADLNGIFSA